MVLYGFSGRFQMAGTRGFGIFMSTNEGPEPRFIVQHRTVDEGSPILNTTYPVSVVFVAFTPFCPWCGVTLKKFYRKSYVELDHSDLRVPI